MLDCPKHCKIFCFLRIARFFSYPFYRPKKFYFPKCFCFSKNRHKTLTGAYPGRFLCFYKGLDSAVLKLVDRRFKFRYDGWWTPLILRIPMTIVNPVLIFELPLLFDWLINWLIDIEYRYSFFAWSQFAILGRFQVKGRSQRYILLHYI